MSDNTERDELARVIFLQKYPGSEGAWDNANDFGRQHWWNIADAILEWLHTAGYRKQVAVEGDAGKLIEELDSGCNDGGDLPSLLSRAARAIESQQQRIRDLEAELKAAYASETYEQRRAEQAEATIARVREWLDDGHNDREHAPLLALLDASPEKGGQS